MKDLKLKPLEIKKKHHYVWAQYLRQWAHGNDVWYITSKGGNIRIDSVESRSQDLHFYKINELNEKDIEFIELFPTTDSPAIQEFHASQLKLFKKLSAMINIPSTLKNTEYLKELEELSEWASNNPLEETYTIIELSARPIMQKLWSGDASCLKENSNMICFCNYIAHQLARTKKIKDQTFLAMKNSNQDNKLWADSAKLFEKNWWFIGYKTGINFGHSLYQSARTTNHILIKNTTNIDFITSDFPVINAHQSVQDTSANKKIEKLDLYYPLSPKLAYMINDSQHYNHLNSFVNEEDVIKLNLLMAKNSYRNIYGSSEQSLKDLRKSYRNLKV
jgi:hypothetical protein